MNLSLKAHQAMPVIVAGNWIYLETALQGVTLESALGDRVTLKKDAVIKSAQQIGRVLVYSNIDQNITLEFGFGDFVPPANIDGQSIVVSEMPAVELAAGQSINIDQMPAVELASGQEVTTSISNELHVHSGTMPFVLAANSGRRKVHIKAATGNANLILISGVYPLVAGEKIELATQAEIEFTGDATDSVQILEI